MEISYNCFKSICRICLNFSENLVSIFSESHNIQKRMLSIAKIEISNDDDFPSQICSICLINLNLSFDFQSLCQNSDMKLREIVFNHQNCKQLEVKTIIDEFFIKTEPLDDENTEDNDFIEQSENDIKTRLRPTGKRKYVRVKPLRFHQCEPCGKHFKTKKHYDYHNLKIHGIDKKCEKNVCQICQESFKNWKSLVEHEKEFKHYRKISCHVCNKRFSRSYLSEHMQSHSGVKSFLCNLCGKNFSFSSSFKKHSLVCGIDEKKMKCSFCSSSFHTLSRLKDHQRSHSKEKPYVCENCGKEFRTKDKLTIHQLIHTNSKPYPCETCGRRFRQRIHLKEHFRIHSGIKPFICDLCGASFTQGHCLKKHKSKSCTK